MLKIYFFISKGFFFIQPRLMCVCRGRGWEMTEGDMGRETERITEGKRKNETVIRLCVLNEKINCIFII